MKKLTAGIFAGILTVVTVNAADAAIASKAYVDQQRDGNKELIDANAADISALQATVGTHTTDITGLKASVADLSGEGEGSIADKIAGALDGKLGELGEDTTVKAELDKKQDKSSKAYSMGNAQGGWTALEDDEVAALTSGITSAEVQQITTNKTDIATISEAYKLEDTAIRNLIGEVTEDETVVSMIEAVQTAAAGNVDTKLGNLGEGNATVADALAEKQDTLGATNVKTAGSGNAVISVTAEDGVVTATKGDVMPAVPATATGTTGTFVLTATVTADGVTNYMWESIERAAPATQE